MKPKEFTAVEYTNQLNGPAGVSLSSGTLYLNRKKWEALSPRTQRLILLHEQGHLQYGSNEFAADEHSFWRMLEFGEDSLNVVEAFYNALPFSTPEQIERSEAMLTQALEYEASRGNAEAKGILGFAENGTLPADTCEFVITGTLVAAGISLLATSIASGAAIHNTKKTNKSNEKIAEENNKAAKEEADKQREAQEKQAALDRAAAARQAAAATSAAQKESRLQQAAILQAAEKKAKTTKMVIIVVALAAVGFLAYKNKDKINQLIKKIK